MKSLDACAQAFARVSAKTFAGIFAKACASAFAVVCVMAASTPARAADPQGYKVEFASAGGGDIDATVKATSDLATLRKTAPVGPYGLIARARSDMDRLKTALESFGYYQSKVVIKINDMLVTNPSLGEILVNLPKGTDAQVAVGFVVGPLYHIGRVDIEGDLPPDARSSLGLNTGEPAVAGTVLAAQARLLNALQERGYAFAKVDAPVAYEAADAPVLDLRFHVDAGAHVNVGRIHFVGMKRTKISLLTDRVLLHTGQPYSASAVERARRDMLALGVFNQVTVTLGAQVDETGGVPITFTIRERLRHAISLNAAYSSDLGGSGGVTWTDRNVFGHAEQLTLAASIINVGGSDTTGVGYDTSAKLLLPDIGRRDQSLEFKVEALKQQLQAYDQTARTSTVTLTRKFTSRWTASIGGSTADEQIIQEGVTRFYTLFSTPLTVGYDSTDLTSPLDDPRRGIRTQVTATPTLALGHPDARFVITLIKASAYFDLNHFLPIDPGRTVLAARAIAGLASGAGEFSLPPDQRFYGGGSATIRGYGYQKVGPTFPNDPSTPIGGTAIEAGGFELRQRFGTNFGAAFFVDAGQVSASLRAVPGEVRVGYGAGVRYYTPIGPLRLDFALPTQRGPNDDAFEVYIGLGQAF